MIDFGRPGHRLVADPVADGKVHTRAPFITREQLRFPIAEATARVADPRREAAGDAHAKVRDRVPAEIVTKINHAALAAGLVAIDLPPH